MRTSDPRVYDCHARAAYPFHGQVVLSSKHKRGMVRGEGIDTHWVEELVSKSDWTASGGK